MFKIIEKKKAIIKNILITHAYSSHRNLRLKRYPFTILIILNKLKILLNSNRGPNRTIPYPIESDLLAAHSERFCIYFISPPSNIGVKTVYSIANIAEAIRISVA